MQKQTILFNYGCPRSGTTFVRDLIDQGKGSIPRKIVEYIMVHPCNADNGLIDLRRLFDGFNVVFLRSVRNPIDIFKSFYAARKIIAETEEDFRWRNSLEGLANMSDKAIFRSIENERNNTEAQRHKQVGKHKLNIIELDYDRLPDVKYRKEIVATIAEQLPDSDNNRKLMYRWMEDSYIKKPSRAGALSFKVEIELPADLVSEINRRFPT